MHALASVLHCRVADILSGMSAQEFAHWQEWLRTERVGPEFDAIRHAELLAATHNGASTKRGGGHWLAADFLPETDPWAEPPAPVPAADAAASEAEALRRGLAQLERCF
jgi:hypothetical protein